ncbi:MAG: DUF3524 domain-containing protein [Thermoleophilia bacterium]|nr:DUF3524 domain-containing protein [Thermoleophilia bacterium]
MRLSSGTTELSSWAQAGAMPLRVWAVEPYLGGSHQAFVEGLARHSRHSFTVFGLPGRHWKWRMQGGALSLAREVQRQADKVGTLRRPQVFFVSDMLDLPTFLACLGPDLSSTATIVYFHENQFSYPLPPGVERDLTYGFRNLVSAWKADRVLFNSRFHLEEFFSAAREVLDKMPDESLRWAVEEARSKSAVLPLGCDLRRLDRYRAQGLRDAQSGRWGDVSRGPLVVWNQRWEYDKAPEALFAALREVRAMGARFRLAVAGKEGPLGNTRELFAAAREELAELVVHWGEIKEESVYASLLWAADVVVSTAIHEFFGTAVVEAIYCGCRPVLPRRLSYPELLPEEVHGRVFYDEGELVPALLRALANPKEWSCDWQRTWVARYDWGSIRRRYDEEIANVWQKRGHYLGKAKCRY